MCCSRLCLSFHLGVIARRTTDRNQQQHDNAYSGKDRSSDGLHCDIFQHRCLVQLSLLDDRLDPSSPCKSALCALQDLGKHTRPLGHSNTPTITTISGYREYTNCICIGANTQARRITDFGRWRAVISGGSRAGESRTSSGSKTTARWLLRRPGLALPRVSRTGIRCTTHLLSASRARLRSLA